MLETRPLSALAALLILATCLPSSDAQAQGFERPKPAVSIRTGVQYLWTTDGLECIAGCEGTAEPIRLGTGIEWNVTVDNFDFTPQILDIELGDSVTWTGNKGLPHNVVFDEENVPDGVDAEALSHADNIGEEGEKVTTKFTKAGTYGYYCEPHRGAGMNGTVIVQ